VIIFFSIIVYVMTSLVAFLFMLDSGGGSIDDSLDALLWPLVLIKALLRRVWYHVTYWKE
jgi:hypothetical protein